MEKYCKRALNGRAVFGSPVCTLAVNGYKALRSTHLEHVANAAAYRVVDETEIKGTVYFHERCEGSVVRCQRENAPYEIMKRGICTDRGVSDTITETVYENFGKVTYRYFLRLRS